MKVQVNLKCSKLETAANGALSLSVSLDDTVCAIKERLELIEPAAALTGARLVYQEKELDDDMRLTDCGIKEGVSLDLVVVAPLEDFAQQLAELLKARDLPLEELSLLYSHRYGATTGQVLKLLGTDEKLSHFLRERKQFVVEGGLARLASPPLKPPGAKLQHIPEAGQKPRAEGAKVSVSVRLLTPSAGEVVTSVGLTIGAADTVVDLKERVAEAEMIPFADKEMIFNGETLEDSRRLMDCRIHNGSCVELVVRATEKGLAAQLAGLLRGREQRASSPDELSLLFCYRYGTPVARALKLLGLKETVRGFIKRQEEFVLDNGCVTLASVNADRALDAILEAASFLNMHKVDRSIKGTSAKAIIHLAGLPSECRELYMPRLLQSVAAGLQERLEGQAFSAIDVSGDAVQVRMDPLNDHTFIQGDVADEDTLAQLLAALGDRRADVVLSDLAPPLVGLKYEDHMASMQCCLYAAKIMEKVLRLGGWFIVKLHWGPEQGHWRTYLDSRFETVRSLKPPASRRNHREMFCACRGFRGRPRLAEEVIAGPHMSRHEGKDRWDAEVRKD